MLKSTIILAVVLLSVSVSTSYAKIWRVNNNPSVTADFTTLAAAHTGAASGDTLHLEGSPNSYGGLTCTKKLIIIGPGFFLAQNPNTQALKYTAKVDAITLNAGSAGTEIMGLDFNNNSLNIYSHDIIVKRNKFASASGNSQDWTGGLANIYYVGNTSTAANNIIISQNYGVRVDVNYASTGILVSNNYMLYGSAYGDGTTGICLNAHANAIVLVQNNIFRNGKVTCYNSNVTNNIMVAGTFEGTGNLVSNNISNAAQFGTTNNNKANQNMAAVFVGAGDDVSPDGQWKLKAGSPAIGAGFGSTQANPIDAGMYDARSPYVLAGLPPVPAIYFFENQPIGSNTDPIDVTIKVKSVN